MTKKFTKTGWMLLGEETISSYSDIGVHRSSALCTSGSFTIRSSENLSLKQQALITFGFGEGRYKFELLDDGFEQIGEDFL